ncbi:MAG: aminotransferase class IV [Bacteroidota bacterium]
MCLLFETIRIENGIPVNLTWHQRRMNQACREIWKVDFLQSPGAEIHVPEEYSNGLVRCNLRYGPGIMEIKFNRYEKRTIRSLKLVIHNNIDYHLKYADRAGLEALFELRETCDDILLVKNGLITDTSMSNIIFFDGNHWVTPAKPLLIGTCRERLLNENQISAMDIRPEDLARYKGWKLINAMRNPEEEEMMPVAEIKW